MIKKYQQYVLDGMSPKYRDLGFALIALVGEVGEVCDAVKKSCIYTDANESLNKTQLMDELGDVLWQWMACVNSLQLDVEQVINYNINKLNARHGGACLDKSGGKR